MRTRALVVLGLAGCSFQAPTGATGGDAPQHDIDAPARDDAGHDASVTHDTAPVCFGTGLVKPCFDVAPTGDNHVQATTTIDTDDDNACTKVLAQTTGEEVCVIAAGTIEIDATLTATGKRPLVLVATTMLTVGATGVIDVSSKRNRTTGGAGSNSSLCTTAGAGQDDNGGAGGGGAGGSFAGKGGDGFIGANGFGGTGGVAGNAVALGVVHGGCPGGAGGTDGTNTGGPGNKGGGAVYLIAGTSISLAGFINANGAGGGAGGPTSGGGGAGSGGFIGLDASSITNTGTLMANGGGGGEGGGNMSGDPGEDPDSRVPNGPAGGGHNNFNGGDGGSGSTKLDVTGAAGHGDSGGGGGGGGAGGIIKTFPTKTLGGAVSPSAS